MSKDAHFFLLKDLFFVDYVDQGEQIASTTPLCQHM